ncbi:hypothetical protein Tco_1292404 [Tanacetum coccineum]
MFLPPQNQTKKLLRSFTSMQPQSLYSDSQSEDSFPKGEGKGEGEGDAVVVSAIGVGGASYYRGGIVVASDGID